MQVGGDSPVELSMLPRSSTALGRGQSLACATQSCPCLHCNGYVNLLFGIGNLITTPHAAAAALTPLAV